MKITPEEIQRLRELWENACNPTVTKVEMHLLFDAADENVLLKSDLENERARELKFRTENVRLRDALSVYAESGFWEFGNAKPEGGYIARAALKGGE